jgi:predicted cobalt transporter CbtA
VRRREPGAPTSVRDLSGPQRRRVILLSAVRTGVSLAVLLLVYLYFPVGGLEPHDAAGFVLRSVVVLAAFAFFLAYQVRAIFNARLPEVRSVEALINGIAVFLAMSALLYLSLSISEPGSFNRHLTHNTAWYFATTVFATVGFGDIVPTTDQARLMVSGQMLLDLVIIALVVRVLLYAAKAGLRRGTPEGETPELTDTGPTVADG